ncbi:hypothetical protein BJ912DRAFT_1068330 [Pholiota molesta]|nr:hypothetical protein BJ912DRAFT_1068330 [Pholiota molesta]
MVHPTDAQHFAATYDPNPPRSRQSSGLLGSIWAPQPQPSETTWPRTLDSFSRVAERESDPTSRQDGRAAALRQIISREDVFGSPQPTQAQQVSGREVGAIGDGRKKKALTTAILYHVEQLLRTLNLNSPVPFGLHKPSPLTMNIENSPKSPDFSPASASSALLTPTDLSPTEGRSK